ncbi:MAG: hypothetical protein RLZZ584_2392 [Pseudomonadota bacterium]|jgi:uncharacterized membrane protein
MPNWRILAALAVLPGYALASHQLMVHWPEQPWTVALLFGPLLGGVAAAAWWRRDRLTLAGCALVALVLGVVVQRGGVGINLLYVLQHGAIHAMLAWTFGTTLRAGSTPLITALAEKVHERFAPGQRDYTRRLTAVWTAYFVVMIAVSLAIYLLAPWPWWSLYCNVLTPLAALAMFALEHAWRVLRHPDFERVQIARAIRAYQAHTAADSSR